MAPSDLASFLAGQTPADDMPAGSTGAPEPAAAAPAAPSGVAQAGAQTPKILLNERFEIDPGRPISELDHAGADAFVVRRTDAGTAELFAYVARSGLPARHDFLMAMRAIDHASVLTLISHGIAYWPADGFERLIVIYERPARRLVPALGEKVTPMREDEVIRALVRPVTSALEELNRLRIVHGAINPTNLLVGPGDSQPLLLGDCVTTPTGYIQPVAFETIGRAMASPQGRGIATHEDDLYALGVSIVYMLLGRLPDGERDDPSLITAKIESGSFSALVGDETLPQTITEPVRGLLLDDPGKRWTLDDLQTWLGGRRQSPRRAEIIGRLQRPVTFKDHEYHNVRSLAAAMATDTATADSYIEDGTLEGNLARAANDDDLQGRIEEAKRTATLGRGGPLSERRVARVLMALDPQAPIRYRGQSVMPEGVGSALAHAFATGQGMQELGEIIAAQLPMAWISFQYARDESVVPLIRQFDTLSGFVGESVLGYGIERCLYELDSSIPCGGPLTLGRHILDATAFLLALESISARSDRPQEPIDRHAAAFLMSRHARLIHEPVMVLSGDALPYQRCAALVKLYDILQRRASVPRLPGLCRWLASLAEPAIEQYHSRSLRDRLKANLNKVWKSGEIHNLTAFIGNNQLSERDDGGFRAATMAHAQATRSIAARRRELERKADIAGAQGRQAAAIIASLLSVMMAVGAVLMTVF